MKTARRVLIVLAWAVLVFILEESLELSPAFVTLGAATVALVWIRPNMQETLCHAEWSVQLFFSGLFVMVGGLDAAGVNPRPL
jgi:Na+/H+ antiporter NhaD/arsenite permease-like protein